MITFDEVTFDRYLQNKDVVAAKELLEHYFKQLTPEDEGEVYVKAMSTYIKASNRLTERYSELLDQTITVLEHAKKVEQEVEDALNLKKSRKHLT